MTLSLLASAFDDGDFFFCEAVEFVDQLVDLLVGGGDLALEGGAVVIRLRRLQSSVEVEHLLD